MLLVRRVCSSVSLLVCASISTAPKGSTVAGPVRDLASWGSSCSEALAAAIAARRAAMPFGAAGLGSALGSGFASAFGSGRGAGLGLALLNLWTVGLAWLRAFF